MNDAHQKMVDELTQMAPRSLDRDPLLVEREATHGSFQTVADLSQNFKRMFRKELGARSMRLDVRHAEALDMIAVKLARVLAGNVNERDHWDDIAGYAKLGSEACE